MSLLTVTGLRASYRGRGGPAVEALRGVNLSLEAGQLHGLAGESGSGKSTLARCLVQLLQPTNGSIRFDGQCLQSASPALRRDAQRRIQLIFQDPGSALSPRRTIAQTLREPAQHFGLPAADRDLADALAAVGLEAAALARYPQAFSSGQRQRIAIARALICKPDLLVADEALSALDVSVQAQVLELLHQLRRERNLSILLISHDLSVLQENSELLSVMYRGRIVEQGQTRQLTDRSAHPYTQQLFDAVPALDPEQAPPRAPAIRGLATRAAKSGGCAFRRRCPRAEERCAAETPAWRALQTAPAHHVECHRADMPDGATGNKGPAIS